MPESVLRPKKSEQQPAQTEAEPTVEEWKGPLRLALESQLASQGWTMMGDADARLFQSESLGAELHSNIYGEDVTVLLAGPPFEYQLFWKRGGGHPLPEIHLDTVPHPEGAYVRLHMPSYKLLPTRKGDPGSSLTIGRSAGWESGGYTATPSGWKID